MMKEIDLQGKLTWFDRLSEAQGAAVYERDESMVVTAGAGCGKTSTLVGRYLSLLAEGHSPLKLAAITFTEKAAREMRSRVRQSLSELSKQSGSDEERAFWAELEGSMDAARIGTIHSLCAEILRSHPAEALLDPQFEVLDEGMTALLRTRVVDDALLWLIDEMSLPRLLNLFSFRNLKLLAEQLLKKRLDVASRLQSSIDPHALIKDRLEDFLQNEQVRALMAELRELKVSGDLAKDAGEKLEAQINALLADWGKLSGDAIEDARVLIGIRKKHTGLRAGKKTSQAKAALRELRDHYDEILTPWLGGAKKTDPEPDLETEAAAVAINQEAGKFFEKLLELYQARLNERQALDFDDLELKAMQLLENPEVRANWQAELDALMVDEFQDTNERQRRIIEALSGGEQGNLFVVGDERQSIYRFRGADVGVFARVKQDIRRGGGKEMLLNQTFRSHAALLDGMGDLLEPVMGLAEDALHLQETDKPFEVRYSPLEAMRAEPEGAREPFLEFILAEGEESADGRAKCAMKLVERLVELKRAGEIRDWSQVALLFRASSGYEAYEEALAAWNVPYVTVAGRGFYDRPEIRDVLNLLRALADPHDDLLMAGLLRSPALGLSDQALYQLRWSQDPDSSEKHINSYQYGLKHHLEQLSPVDRERAVFARRLLDEFVPLVDRLPVGEVLQKLLLFCKYQVIMAVQDERINRNLDKLLDDAYASGLVRLRDFLEYVENINAAGVREGEAAIEAQGALQLMTIHKAKGLEFDLVVLADASRKQNSRSEQFYLFEQTGLCLRLDSGESQPLVYRIAVQMDRERNQAEEKRLLYVALTRAKEKLLISGHYTNRLSRCYLDWLLRAAIGDDYKKSELLEDAETPRKLALRDERLASFVLTRQDISPSPLDEERVQAVRDDQRTERVLSGSLKAQSSEKKEEQQREFYRPGEDEQLALAAGTLFHRAAQLWLDPQDEYLERTLQAEAFTCLPGKPELRESALRRACMLYQRFWQSSIRQELQAWPRQAELSYTLSYAENRFDQGFFDLFCERDGEWLVVEFKTDHIANKAEQQEQFERHRAQLEKYQRAGRILRGVPGRVCLCWLDRWGEVFTQDI